MFLNKLPSNFLLYRCFVRKLGRSIVPWIVSPYWILMILPWLNLGREMENKELLQIHHKLMQQSLLQLQTDNFPLTIL